MPRGPGERGELMSAGAKGNGGAVIGSLVLAALAGAIAGSWAIFAVTLVVLLAAVSKWDAKPKKGKHE
jgi:hypothetical protein